MKDVYFILYTYIADTVCLHSQREDAQEAEPRGAGGGLGTAQGRAALHPQELVVGGVGRARLRARAGARQHVRRARARLLPAPRRRRRAARPGGQRARAPARRLLRLAPRACYVTSSSVASLLYKSALWTYTLTLLLIN